MKVIHPIKAAVTLAVLLMLFHACWAAAVAFGWAQPLINFILRVHFIQPFYVILPFDFVMAFMLLAITGGVGFIAGLVFATLWNRLHAY